MSLASNAKKMIDRERIEASGNKQGKIEQGMLSLYGCFLVDAGIGCLGRRKSRQETKVGSGSKGFKCQLASQCLPFAHHSGNGRPGARETADSAEQASEGGSLADAVLAVRCPGPVHCQLARVPPRIPAAVKLCGEKTGSQCACLPCSLAMAILQPYPVA